MIVRIDKSFEKDVERVKDRNILSKDIYKYFPSD